MVCLLTFLSLSLPCRSETPAEETKEDKPKRSSLAAMADGIASALGGGGAQEKEKSFSLANVDSILPRIRRGLVGGEEKDDGVVVGWKAQVRTRKDREEVLRCVLFCNTRTFTRFSTLT